MEPVIAQISGHSLLAAFIWLLIAGVIYWVLSWGLAEIGLPEPFQKIARVVLVLVVVVLLVNALLAVAGHPLIVWP